MVEFGVPLYRPSLKGNEARYVRARALPQPRLNDERFAPKTSDLIAALDIQGGLPPLNDEAPVAMSWIIGA